MVNLYKEWYLDADDKSYFVGRVLDGKMVNPAKYPTAAEAVNHVIEAELRKGIKKHDLLNCGEFLAMYSAVADDVVEAVAQAPQGLNRAVVKNYRPHGYETRGKA